MKHFLLSTMLSVLCGTSAFGQTDTNCFQIGMHVNCRSQPSAGTAPTGPTNYLDALGVLPDPAGAFQQGLENAQHRRSVEARTEEIRLRTAEIRRQTEELKRATELRREVGNLVGAGDCDGAVKAALRGGDFDLAERAKALCPAK